jgi:DeoR family glycerol-3-phosphate regulon repressor/DeoR family fructose operon transcriptional repressor
MNAETRAALPARRRAKLVELARERGQIAVADVAAAFGVSGDTIRRDLELLEQRGLLARTHGGAVLADQQAARALPFDHRAVTNRDAKRRIGAVAADMIATGETLLVSGGTTTVEFAHCLTDTRGLTIVTNNLRVALELPTKVAREIFLLGGLFHLDSLVTTAPLGLPGVRGISADRAVISAGGITRSGGISTANVGEAALVTEMIAASAETVLLCDASKFDRDAFAHIAGLNEIDVLITDRQPTRDQVEWLREAEIELVVADSTDERLD